ncbi:MAG: alpha/beta fold hydrolase, partial [Acidobacteriota bacterium]|nr:alpha/beta fold hydrolase [Acidobacteriota bacterium]
VLRFDFTGLGESEGDFADTDFSSNLDDLLAAADYLRREHRAPDLLIGHSLGGAAVLAVAAEIPEVAAVATIGAPSNTAHLRDQILSQAPELDSYEEAEVTLAGRPFRIRRSLLDDLDRQRLLDRVASMERPLMILHSPEDVVVDIRHAGKIYAAAKHPKSFVSLDGADHLLLARERDGLFVGRLLASWAGRYLPASPASPASVASQDTTDTEAAVDLDSDLEPGTVRVSAATPGFANLVEAGRHRLPADEPLSVGGTDTGPNPYDYLLAALGACKSITLRMYANRKKWPLEKIAVTLRHERIHASDCEECVSTEGRVDHIDAELEIEGPLSDEQRQRLVEIAGRCPVHRTLTSETVIHTEEIRR